MLTTSHLEDYIVTNKKGVDVVRLGGSHGQRVLKERYLSQPSVFFDLNEGYDDTWPNSPGDKKLSVTLQWLMLKSPERNLEKVLSGAKVVSRRGILSRMALGDYLKEKGDWQLVCEKRHGAIFLEEEVTEKELVRRTNCSQMEKSSCYWGNRFEKYMVENKSGDDLAESLASLSIEDTKIQVVMTATLIKDDMKMLYSGKVDAVDSNGCHVQLKTLKQRFRGFGYWFWKEKSLKWWMQSRLVNTDYFIIGMRDEVGHVHQLRKMTLDELENREWNGDDCLFFLYDVLKLIDENLNEAEAARVTCTNGDLRITKIPSEEAGILTKEFKEHFKL